MIIKWLKIIVKINLILLVLKLSPIHTASEDASTEVSFLAADERTIYKAQLFESAGATTVDMRWSPIVTTSDLVASSSAANSTHATAPVLTDFDFDTTRHRLVFANSDPVSRTVSVSECYLLRLNEDHLSCSLTTSLIYRQINTAKIPANSHQRINNGIFLALDWLTGDVYILLPGLFVRCPLPGSQAGRASECVESKVSDALNPSIVRLDPFSRSLIWNQKRSYKAGREQFCIGINRAALTQSKPLAETSCLLNDAGVTSIFVNHSTGAIVFTNASRDSIFQLRDQKKSAVSVARKFANEGYADSVVNCPAPVRSLTYLDETDVYFWTAPDVRKRPIRADFSQILAFEVDGLCSSHPTSKDMSRVAILPPTPRLDDSFLKSTLTEQVRCHCTPLANFTLQVNCRWVYSPLGHSIRERHMFFLVEIGNQLYYRTPTPSFSTILTRQQLINELKMSDAIALHIAIRVCSKWYCALPANAYVQQSPFAPISVQAYRAFANVLPSFAVSLRWQLPNLFQAVTSVTLAPDTAPDTFYHQSTVQEEAIFENLSASNRFLAKVETCNIWNCSETAKLPFKTDELKFEPISLCWKNTTPSLTVTSKFYPSSRQNVSRSVVQIGSQGVQSAVYLLSLGGKNGSIAWIEAQKWRIFRTEPSGETRLLVDGPPNAPRIRRHSLGFDFLASRLFWIESDLLSGRNSAELHSIKLALLPNQQHFVYQLPNDQIWTRLSVNSTSGALFVLSGDAMAPTGALVFDLLTNKIIINFENEIATAVDRILTTERTDFSENCQQIFDENAISLYDNRVCFDLNRTELVTKNASSPNSISISLLSVSNDLCLAKSALRRFVLQSAIFYLLPANSNFAACLRRDKTCLRKRLSPDNGTATFTGFPAFTDYQLFAELKISLFNQSRLWNLGRVRTQPALPNEPRNFRCSRVTPEEVVLEWQPPIALNGPGDQVEFILRWQEPSEQDPKKLVGRSMEVDGVKPVTVSHLQPDWLYEFRLVARSRLFPSTETSQPVFARCKTASVGKFAVLPVALERSKLAFRFSPSQFQTSPNTLITSATIAYGLASELRLCSQDALNPDNKVIKRALLCSRDECSQSNEVTKIINGLQPKTFYRFCLVLNYLNAPAYIYPQYFNLVVETGGFKLETPRVWTSFAGVEVLIFASGEPPKILTQNAVPNKTAGNSYSSNNRNQIGDYQLVYSDDPLFCNFYLQNNVNFSRRIFSRNVTSASRSIMALRKEDFEIDRNYWFRLSLTVEDQIWLSDCSDAISVHLGGDTGTTAQMALVGRSGLVAATGLIALISCASVVAFCLSLAAFVFLFRRVGTRLSSAKLFIGRYFCRLLDYSGLSNTVRSRHGCRFEFNNFSNHHFIGGPIITSGGNRSRSTASGGGLIMPTMYSTSSSGGTSLLQSAASTQQQQTAVISSSAPTMTLMNAGRGVPATGGLWSLSTLSPDTSPVTATSSAGPGGMGAGSVFSFECDNTMANSVGTVSTKGTYPLRFLTLTNQIYATPSGLSNWLHQLPPNVLRLSRDQIRVSRFLGAGAFGEVYEGELSVANDSTNQIETYQVAVKTLKPDADTDRRASFCREASLMSHFSHPNIVRLIGMCIAPSPHCTSVLVPAVSPLSAWPLMVLELMNGGDLLGYLRRARQATEKAMTYSTNQQISEGDDQNCLKMADLFDICIDVAAGCRYLEKNRFCHRDIAARNCLVSCPEDGSGRRVVKIGDFGLARTLDCSAECYRKVGEGLMPVRWMAPESLNDGIFTTQSDIWSFGVLMFEVFSLGRQPYAGRANHEVFEMVKVGSHPECPRECPTAVCRLMLSCFQMLPENRPSFKVLLHDLKTIRTNSLMKSRAALLNPVLKSKSSSNLIMASTPFECTDSSNVSAYATLARQKPPRHDHYCRNAPARSESDTGSKCNKNDSKTPKKNLSPLKRRLSMVAIRSFKGNSNDSSEKSDSLDLDETVATVINSRNSTAIVKMVENAGHHHHNSRKPPLPHHNNSLQYQHQQDISVISHAQQSLPAKFNNDSFEFETSIESVFI